MPLELIDPVPVRELQPPLLGALGDIHGDFAAAAAVMRARPDVSDWLSVGDVANDRYEYFEPPGRLHWIMGNNEDFDLIDTWRAGVAGRPGLHFLPNATLHTIAGLRIVGLGGTFAPTMYGLARAALPHPKPRDFAKSDRRRHFVREEVERCKSFDCVDILLTHEAPRPFVVHGRDAGKTPINELLSAVRPRLHLFGHHHQFQAARRRGVTSVCLEPPARSYLLISTRDLAFARVEGDGQG